MKNDKTTRTSAKSENEAASKVVSNGIEPFEGFEHSQLRPSPLPTVAHDNSSSEEHLEDDSTNVQKARNVQEAREDISLNRGYDPRELASEVWHLLASSNSPPRLFMADAGPVRVEVIDGRPAVK